MRNQKGEDDWTTISGYGRESGWWNLVNSRKGKREFRRV